MAELGPETLRWMEGAKSTLSPELRATFRDLAAAWEADLERIRVLEYLVAHLGGTPEDLLLVERIRELEQGCAEFRRRLCEWSQAYPTDLFPEPPHGEHGKTAEGCSARMGRHVTKALLEDFDKLVPVPAPAPEEVE